MYVCVESCVYVCVPLPLWSLCSKAEDSHKHHIRLISIILVSNRNQKLPDEKGGL